MIITADDVALLCNYANFSDTTIPTLTQVERLIESIETEVLFLMKKNNIQLDDENKKIIKIYIIKGVAGMILTTLLNNNQSEGGQINQYRKDYLDFLQNMVKFFKKTNIVEGMD